MRDACSMLVQILVDKEASYYVSRRVEEMFKIKHMMAPEVAKINPVDS